MIALNLPSGMVTFLFTDIEGSTKLWEEYPEAMRLALARHDSLLRQAIENHNGYVFKTVGDAFCAAFVSGSDALNAALACHLLLLNEAWEQIGLLRIRVALHTGEAQERNGDYFGPTINRVARLQSLGYGQQTLLSEATYALVYDNLPSEVTLRNLGLHRLKDLQRPEQVFQLNHPALPTEFPPLKSLDNPTLPNNLPLQLTSFVGRETEVAAVTALLDTTRLLTLTGTDGLGKTRLSLQAAANRLEKERDGTWLIELASLADPALVPQTVASVLGVTEQPGTPLMQTLVEWLKARRLLLILDNCEHLLDACAHLADALLKNCPHLHILASSREALGINGEQVYRVTPLSVPTTRQAIPMESLTQYEAVRLFLERATAVRSTFAVTAQNAPALTQLCVRLDGIPLALELAAARVRSLSAEEINARLDDRFHLLTGGSRVALPRQQTLRALIDWSYDLLDEREKALFRRLAAFAGGWTLPAAEQVCVGDPIEEWEMLDLLASLVDKSLVIDEEQAGTTRYRMLETIQQYARHRLEERTEAEAVRERHQIFYKGLAEEAERHRNTPTQREWLDRLEVEHDNLRAALDWRANEQSLSLAGSLWSFWLVRGYLREGRDRLAGLLAATAGQPYGKTRAMALNSAGILAWSQSDYGSAKTLYEESLALQREAADKANIAAALGNLGNIAHVQGDYHTAKALYEENLALQRELGDMRNVAIVLNNLGAVAQEQGNYETARAMLEESLTLRREAGDKWGMASSLSNLGHLAYSQGDYQTARALHDEVLAIDRELGDKRSIAMSLSSLGSVAERQGDFRAAETLQAESLMLRRELGDRRGVAESLEDFASLAVSQEQAVRAARLWGASEVLREDIQAPLTPSSRAERDHKTAKFRTAVSEDAFAAAWTQGRAMTMEQAIEYALEQAEV